VKRVVTRDVVGAGAPAAAATTAAWTASAMLCEDILELWGRSWRHWAPGEGFGIVTGSALAVCGTGAW
jgi:hypothetical protein